MVRRQDGGRKSSKFATHMSSNPNTIISSAVRTIALQAEALKNLENFIDDAFVAAVDAVVACTGRLVVTGIGKSAIIAQKVVATMNSTGTPALFMHAADAIHGDLGMIQSHDVVMVVSKSGDSPEIKVLLPLLQNFGNKIIGMVGNENSYLARHCDIVINTTVQQEACPNNLAPTTSTTAQMVMGDALAICLMEAKEFTSGDFAKFHPGGALGKKLYLKVADMVMADENPMVLPTDNIKNVILTITQKRLGAAAVLSERGNIIGIITDGDIRRMIEQHEDFTSLTAADIMGGSPKTIAGDALAVEALQLMRQHNISQLIATNEAGYLGILHLHDMVREGIL